MLGCDHISMHSGFRVWTGLSARPMVELAGELPLLAQETRSVRVYLLVTAIVAFCLTLGLDLYAH
jgi:hypothetical protein